MKFLSIAVLGSLILPACGHGGAVADIRDGLVAEDPGLPMDTSPELPGCDACSTCSSMVSPSSPEDAGDAGSPPAIVSVDYGSSSAFSSLALQLNGTTQFVRLGDLVTDSGSISMWIKTSGNGVLFSKRALGSSNPGEMRLSIQEDKLWFYIDRGDMEHYQIHSMSDVNDNGWHHVLVTFNPGMKMFVDGLEQRRAPEADSNRLGLMASGVIAEFGRNNAQPLRDPYYAGLIDEVAIFDSVLDVDQVALLYNDRVPDDLLAPGSLSSLQHWWRLGEEDTLPVLKDSLRSMDGTLSNSDGSRSAAMTKSTIQDCSPH